MIDKIMSEDIEGIDIIKEVTFTLNGVKVNAMMKGRIDAEEVLTIEEPTEEK